MQVGYIGGPFSDPVTKIESAVQETEGFGSKALSIKENIQSIVAGLFQVRLPTVGRKALYIMVLLYNTGCSSGNRVVLTIQE